MVGVAHHRHVAGSSSRGSTGVLLPIPTRPSTDLLDVKCRNTCDPFRRRIRSLWPAEMAQGCAGKHSQRPCSRSLSQVSQGPGGSDHKAGRPGLFRPCSQRPPYPYRNRRVRRRGPHQCPTRSAGSCAETAGKRPFRTSLNF